jgi:hypothetical protein
MAPIDYRDERVMQIPPVNIFVRATVSQAAGEA